MELTYTQEFATGYDRLPDRDIDGVNEMLDRLEKEHRTPEMRDVIRIGDVSLFATPRFETPSGEYRVTWDYDESERPICILCFTVAQADRRRSL